MRTPHFIVDLFPEMKEAEIRVVMAIARQTFGWQRKAISLSIPDFERLTGLARPSIVTGIKAAMKHGVLDREPDGNSFSYWIAEPSDDDETVQNFNSQDAVSNEDLGVKNFNSSNEIVSEENDLSVKNLNCDESSPVKNLDSSEEQPVQNLNQNSQNFELETVKKVNSSPVKNLNSDQRNININKLNTLGDRPTPTFINFGNGRPQQRTAKTYIDGIQSRAQKLGLAPKEFTALVDAVLTGMNKLEVAELDTRQGLNEGNSAQECVLSLAKKSIRTPGAIQNLFESWYEYDWRGKKGELPTYELLVDHAAALPRLIAARNGANHGTSNGHSPTNYERPATAQFSQREWSEYRDPAGEDIPY